MSRLNAMDVAAAIHQYQPITVRRLALYFNTPSHRVLYAADWLLKHGYVRKGKGGMLSVVTVGAEPRVASDQNAVLWRDHLGAYHWIVRAVTGDAEFLIRNGWVQA